MDQPIDLIDKPPFKRRPKARSAASIILRGANDFMLDEMERSLHDALCVVKRVLDSKKVVPGGGAVEAALSIYLENFATSLVSSTFSTLHFHMYCNASIHHRKPIYPSSLVPMLVIDLGK